MKNIKIFAKPTENLTDNTKKMLSTHIKNFDELSKVL
jgi:hypothetical protein